jgi:hypothetical protein
MEFTQCLPAVAGGGRRALHAGIRHGQSVMRAIARIQMRNDPVSLALTHCPNIRTVNNFAKVTATPPAARLRICRDFIIFREIKRNAQ